MTEMVAWIFMAKKFFECLKMGLTPDLMDFYGFLWISMDFFKNLFLETCFSKTKSRKIFFSNFENSQKKDF